MRTTLPSWLAASGAASGGRLGSGRGLIGGGRGFGSGGGLLNAVAHYLAGDLS